MPRLLLRDSCIGTIDAVLFDKDGTLSHSEPRLVSLAQRRIDTAARLWCELGSDQSLETRLRESLRHAFGIIPGGLRPDGTIAVAAREDNLVSAATVFCLLGSSWPDALTLAKASFDQVDISDQAASTTKTPSPLLPGAESFLQQLEHHAVPAAVISNDTRAGIEQFLAHHKLTGLFQHNWSADDSPRKPDPEAVAQLCARFRLEPAKCALIGDAETDLQMAIEAGIGCVIGFTGGWCRPPELPSAQHLLLHWNDLVLSTAT